MCDRTDREVKWEKDSGRPAAWQATVAGERWTIEVRAQGLGPLYTLLVNGDVAAELDAWPRPWTMARACDVDGAAAQDDDAAERREMELELEHFERTKGIGPSSLVDADD